MDSAMHINACLRIALFVGLSLSCHLFAGEEFETRLQLKTRLSVRTSTLREVTESVAAANQLTVFIDPRVNPRAEVTPPAADLPILDLLNTLAASCGARACTIGETVIIAPITDADRIATLAALRESELTDKTGAELKLDLLRAKDFAPTIQPVTPRELLAEIDRAFDLSPEGEPLPHDLWFCQLSKVTASEALACVLVPMNRAFEWTADGYRIVELPETLVVTRSHSIPRKLDQASMTASLESIMGVGFEAEVSSKRVSFAATVDQHNRFAALLRPPDSNATRKTTGGEKRYTLTVKGQPAGAVLAALEAEGVPFSWSPAALEAAGIGLQTRVEVEVVQVTAAELLETIAKQIGVIVRPNGDGIELAVP